MLQMLRAILFDLDDTLYPEQEYVLSGFRAVADWAEHHLGIPSQRGCGQLKELFDTGIRGNTFDCWLSGHGLNDPEKVADLVSVYRDHEPHIRLFPDAVDVLPRLHKQYRLGLVTDGYCETQRRKITALSIEDHLDTIVLSDTLGRNYWKPNPKPFQVALATLGINAEDAIYVGDNPEKDFLGARHAGMRSVRIKRPNCEHTQDSPATPEHMPYVTIEILDDLWMALDNIARIQTG
jgi:putative hydrolase of the HAD superfamily